MFAVLVVALCAAPVEPSPWSHEAGMLFAQAGGNTQSRTLGLHARSQMQSPAWRITVRGESLTTRTEGVITTSRHTAVAEAERTVVRWGVGAVARISHFRDPFADWRGLETAELGIGWRLPEEKPWKLNVNGTVVLSGESRVSMPQVRVYPATRIAVAGEVPIAKGVQGSWDADTLFDWGSTQHWKSRATVAVAARIVGAVHMKTVVQVFSVQKPAVGKRPNDYSVSLALTLQWPRKRE